jgi:hypothetical protein
VASAFISPIKTQTMHFKSFYTQQHCYVSIKKLYPGRIRTRVFSFLRGMWCPLRHATRAMTPFSVSNDCRLHFGPSRLGEWTGRRGMNKFVSIRKQAEQYPFICFMIRLLSKQFQFGFRSCISKTHALEWMPVHGFDHRDLRTRRRMHLCMHAGRPNWPKNHVVSPSWHG